MITPGDLLIKESEFVSPRIIFKLITSSTDERIYYLYNAQDSTALSTSCLVPRAQSLTKQPVLPLLRPDGTLLTRAQSDKTR